MNSPRFLPTRVLVALPAAALLRQRAELTLLPAADPHLQAADVAALDRALAHRQRDVHGIIGSPRPGRALALATCRTNLSLSVSHPLRPRR